MDVIPQLAEYRKSLGLSQREAAASVGVARETWARWEAGKRMVDIGLLPKVAEVTGLAPEILRPDLADLLRQPEAAE